MYYHHAKIYNVHAHRNVTSFDMAGIPDFPILITIIIDSRFFMVVKNGT